ncbi:BnaA02g22380D [Brassica napus]|uniref:BnaA02g22380D protein n=2 Tax=Brassica TaxID=3705 RepID=A0A078FP41_BRANA|nr:BnaA02g22380D [Brassica napus]
MTPAKRIRAVSIDFEESFDENSATRNISFVKIKKEKFAKSG